MGIERDFLMRQLMMLFDAIQKILRLRKKGELEEAEKEIHKFYEMIKLDINIENESIESLVNYLTVTKDFTNEHLEMIAFVLKEQGELAKNITRKLDYFQKAYFILQKVERESTSFSMDRQMKLAELKNYLN